MPCRRTPLLLSVILLAAASAAWAQDTRPVEIPLTNGKTLTGVVESADEGEIVLRLGPEQVRRIPWSRLTPLGFYRAKSAVAPAADGEARHKLALLAADLGLHVEARKEFEKAYALGAIKKQAYKSSIAQVERTAVENGVRRAERLAEAGDLEGAMAAARELQIHFATAPNAGAIQALITKLVRHVRELDQDAAREQAELERVVLEVKRNKEIQLRKNKALDLFKNALRVMDEWKAACTQGSVSRARKLAEQADEMFQDARRNLGRLRRILPREHPARRDILVQLGKLDSAQFELRFGMAEMYADQRTWTRAERWAALASYIDPVHPDLVELRDRLLSSRIRYRLSDIANARGRVSGPGR